MTKIVYDPKTEQVVEIDETKEPKWKKKYWHRSGKPFEGTVEEKVAEETKTETLNLLDLESLHKVYEQTFDKKVAPRYRNDRDWIISKLI